ncbi:MAG: hypothetical protein QF441_14915 [Bacteriovoracaceae bacterium]|jgi:acyl carrier protein|nr:hypothetical protein [Halobacteriovoraceae bacterium]MDP7321896.1 hypothetical protein [Bacteriovoracaceae bacterium]|tara:strand:- start:421 stop:672 length:252 start_codon:yes stop_codon:yes gene_type:complete
MKEELRKYILSIKHFQNISEDEFIDDKDLISSGEITSMDMLGLIKFIEDNYHVEVLVSEVTPNNFSSLDQITQYVENKIANKC